MSVDPIAQSPVSAVVSNPVSSPVPEPAVPPAPSNPYTLEFASYDGAAFDLDYSANVAIGSAIDFGGSPAGTRLFIQDSAVSVKQYNAGTAFDLPNFTYSGNNGPMPVGNTQGMAFRADGTEYFISNLSGDTVTGYSIGAGAWDLSGSESTIAGEVNIPLTDRPGGFGFNADGTRMLWVGTVSNRLYSRDLSTPWRPSTGSNEKSFATNDPSCTPRSNLISPDGTIVLIACEAGGMGGIEEWSLSTPNDLNTASYVRTFSTSMQSTNPFGIAFNDDGTKLYVQDQISDKIYRYSL